MLTSPLSDRADKYLLFIKSQQANVTACFSEYFQAGVIIQVRCVPSGNSLTCGGQLTKERPRKRERVKRARVRIINP
jgi:hypothetical protein